MDHDEFARRAEALRARLYRTAYLYLGSEADALEAVDEGVYPVSYTHLTLPTTSRG